MLYRDPTSGEWALRVMAEAADGRVAEDNVDELQRHIAMHPPAPLEKRAATEPSAMQQMPAPQAPPLPVGAEQMVVECPAGVKAGDEITVATPLGELVITVPPGVAPGGKFGFALRHRRRAPRDDN